MCPLDQRRSSTPGEVRAQIRYFQFIAHIMLVVNQLLHSARRFEYRYNLNPIFSHEVVRIHPPPYGDTHVLNRKQLDETILIHRFGPSIPRERFGPNSLSISTVNVHQPRKPSRSFRQRQQSIFPLPSVWMDEGDGVCPPGSPNLQRN